MATTTYHHGTTFTETSDITPIIKSVGMSTIALISISDNADDEHYPVDTPVLLTGITKQDIDNAGDDSLLQKCLKVIKDIQPTKVIVLRLSDKDNVDALDELLTTGSRFGEQPCIIGAPEIDTPAMVRKMAVIADRRLGMVYFSPRDDQGNLLTDKTEIVNYRNSFANRELMMVEGGFGKPEGK